MSSASSDASKDKLLDGINWGPVSAIVVGVLGFIGSQILAVVLLGLALGLYGRDGIDIRSVAQQFAFVILSDLIILLVVGLFLRWRKSSWTALGFKRKPVWDDLTYAFVGYGVYFLLQLTTIAIVWSLTNIDLEQEQELGFNTLISNAEKVMAFASLVILPPIVEEVVFRGFVFGGLRRKLKFVWAALMTSVLFAVPHLFASSDGLLWAVGIDTFVLSLVLCYLREKTGAIWASIVLHALKNSVAFIFLFVIS